MMSTRNGLLVFAAGAASVRPPGFGPGKQSLSNDCAT